MRIIAKIQDFIFQKYFLKLYSSQSRYLNENDEKLIRQKRLINIESFFMK